jgi:hypothetical protein
MKGLTYVEILIVLLLISAVLAIIIGGIKLRDSFRLSRDLQRFRDAYILNSALNFYFRNATNFDPDGPNLNNRGIGESSTTVFISIPMGQEDNMIPEVCRCEISDNSPCCPTYYIYRSSRSDYQKINGSGWIPIDFDSLNSQGLFYLSYLPVDPLNTLNFDLYYIYAFRRDPPQYEIALSFESPKYRFGGSEDKVSKDNGDDPYRLELGTNLNLICPLATSTVPASGGGSSGGVPPGGGPSMQPLLCIPLII